MIRLQDDTTADGQPRRIAIEGMPGSGHTTFAAHLAAAFETVFEPETIVGLSDYDFPESGWELPLCLARLVARYEHQNRLVMPDLFRQGMVSNYVFETHHIWADALLHGETHRLYRKVAGLTKPAETTPDLVVYLQAPVAYLIKRWATGVGDNFDAITGANTLGERQYLEMAESYDRFALDYDAPLLVAPAEPELADPTSIPCRKLIEAIKLHQQGKTYITGQRGLWDSEGR